MKGEKGMKKAQSAIEFMLLIGSIVVFFLVFLYAVMSNIAFSSEQKRTFAAEEITTTAKNELDIAASASGGYHREFFLPGSYGNNKDYSLTIISGSVYFTSENNALALPAPRNVLGTFLLGDYNFIRTEYGNVYLNIDPTQCSDGIDNDGDGLIDCGNPSIQGDEGDPGCWDIPGDKDSCNVLNDDESFATSDCQDNIDNDGDGDCDFDGASGSPGCSGIMDSRCDSLQDYSEELQGPQSIQCNDGTDNDGDGWVDFDGDGDPNRIDPGCLNALDDNEINADTTFSCSNNVDDDVDGAGPGGSHLVDGKDPECLTWNDVGGESQCTNGLDDDLDTFCDWDGVCGRFANQGGEGEGASFIPDENVLYKFVPLSEYGPDTECEVSGPSWNDESGADPGDGGEES